MIILGTGNWGPSGCGNLLPLFLLFMAKSKILHVYIDESGDLSPYSKQNPLYSVAFVFVEDKLIDQNPTRLFQRHLLHLEGGDHFVHVGNLVRAEYPYKNMLREKRIDIFYSLFLLAKFAQYKVVCININKKGIGFLLDLEVTKRIYEVFHSKYIYFNKYSQIILHYDNGQTFLKKSDHIFFLWVMRQYGIC